jgi:protein-tyrosine-phosphatase
MHCGSSMLAGLTATYALSFLSNLPQASAAQLVSGGLIVTALACLSPLHHVQRFLRNLRALLTRIYQRLSGFAAGPEQPDVSILSRPQATPIRNAALTEKELEEMEYVEELRRTFLFVCSGNTCRSPMAAAIANAEIAERLQIPVAALEPPKLVALSAGLSASLSAPMTLEAQQALRSLGVPVTPHSARNLTVELAHQVEKIFCMTQSHRDAVINLVPAVAAKTQCLDPDGDVDDPIGNGMSAYVSCAQRIRALVRLRLDESGLPSPAQS